MIQPYELVVSKVLPTIRARLAKILMQKYRLKQIEVAKHLGVTQAAVSHYNTSSRGADERILKLFPEIEGFVQDMAGKIIKGMPRTEQVAMLNALCKEIMFTERFCNFHRKLASLNECSVCYETPPAQ